MEATIKAVDNGADAIEEFEKWPERYQGIILDFNCPIERGEPPTLRFLTWILPQIYKIDQSITSVVLSGNPSADRMKDFQDDMKFFKKNYQEEECIGYLKDKAATLGITRLKDEYADVFKVFDPGHGHLGPDSEKLLIDCLKEKDTTDTSTIRINFMRFRELLVNIFMAMPAKKPEVIPNEYLKPEVKLGPIITYLRKSLVAGSYYRADDANEEHLVWSVPDQQASLINRTTSMCGGHKAGDYNIDEKFFDAKYEPTKYTYQKVLFAMMDYLLWFKGWMDENSRNG